MKNFRRFAPSEALLCPILCKKWKIFGASRHLRLYFAQFFVKNGKFSALRAIWNMLWRFSMVLAWKNREEIGIFWFQEGEKIGTFGQNVYPLKFRESGIQTSFPSPTKGEAIFPGIVNTWCQHCEGFVNNHQQWTSF